MGIADQARQRAQAVALLEQDRVDATINDKLTFLDYETTNPDAAIKIAAETDDVSNSAFAATTDNAALAEAITGALDELRTDGTLTTIGEKYFGTDISE